MPIRRRAETDNVNKLTREEVDRTELTKTVDPHEHFCLLSDASVPLTHAERSTPF
jgi:hypothetical protein